MKRFLRYLIERFYWGSQGVGITLRAKDTGRLLFMLRSERVNEPNTWGSIGGAVDSGESIEEALLREVREETGFSGQITNLQNYDTFEDGDFKFYNYTGDVESEFTPKLDWENSDFSWRPPGDFPEPLHFGIERVKHLLGK